MFLFTRLKSSITHDLQSCAFTHTVSEFSPPSPLTVCVIGNTLGLIHCKWLPSTLCMSCFVMQQAAHTSAGPGLCRYIDRQSRECESEIVVPFTLCAQRRYKNPPHWGTGNSLFASSSISHCSAEIVPSSRYRAPWRNEIAKFKMATRSFLQTLQCHVLLFFFSHASIRQEVDSCYWHWLLALRWTLLWF